MKKFVISEFHGLFGAVIEKQLLDKIQLENS